MTVGHVVTSKKSWQSPSWISVRRITTGKADLLVGDSDCRLNGNQYSNKTFHSHLHTLFMISPRPVTLFNLVTYTLYWRFSSLFISRSSFNSDHFWLSTRHHVRFSTLPNLQHFVNLLFCYFMPYSKWMIHWHNEMELMLRCEPAGYGLVHIALSFCPLLRRSSHFLTYDFVFVLPTYLYCQTLYRLRSTSWLFLWHNFVFILPYHS